MNYEMGAQKIAGLTVLTILCFLLFRSVCAAANPVSLGDLFRLLLVLGLLSLSWRAALICSRRQHWPNVFVLGLAVLTLRCLHGGAL